MKQSAKIDFDTDSYNQIITKIREEMKRLVNRSLAMHDLLNTKQGSKPWMQFLKELEDKAYLLDFDNHPYKQSDVIKDAAIFGMTDNRLKEKALSEDPDLTLLTKWGQARETGKECLSNLKDQSSSSIQKLKSSCTIETSSDEDEIDSLIDTLKVMKLKKAGRYSNRKKTPKPTGIVPCNNCSSEHAPHRCPANGKDCFACGGKNHFSNSKNCKKKNVNYVDMNYSSESSSDGNEDENSQFVRKLAHLIYLTGEVNIATALPRSQEFPSGDTGRCPPYGVV